MVPRAVLEPAFPAFQTRANPSQLPRGNSLCGPIRLASDRLRKVLGLGGDGLAAATTHAHALWGDSSEHPLVVAQVRAVVVSEK